MIEVKVRFHRTDEELPAQSCWCLCIAECGKPYCLEYSAKWQAFNVSDLNTRREAQDFEIKCVYWAYMTDFEEVRVDDGDEEE
ncbi:MAG: hypothetical protein IKU45_03875 [Clostridia bacterium]|nr:hypothetical protein [Clostridia bacterium]